MEQKKDNVHYAKEDLRHINIKGTCSLCGGYVSLSQFMQCARLQCQVCGAYAKNAADWLKEGSEEVQILRIYRKWPPNFYPNNEIKDYHYLVVYKKQGFWFQMDNGVGNPRGIGGGYKSIDDFGFKILDREIIK